MVPTEVGCHEKPTEYAFDLTFGGPPSHLKETDWPSGTPQTLENTSPNILSAFTRHRADIVANTFAYKAIAKGPCAINTSYPSLLKINQRMLEHARNFNA